MRFAYRDHQGKGVAFVRALLAAGHELVPLGEPADIFLTDYDADLPGYAELLDHYADSCIAVYPHGANPIVSYDGLVDPDPRTALYFVPALGHVEVMRSYGFKGEIVVCGFPYCDLKPFRRCEKPERVLFAPLHPLGDGTISAEAQQKNAAAFEQVLASGLDVTVRLYGTPAENGLWDAPVRWVGSNMNIDYADIAHADVVVAGYGTYGFLSVANGCPTVMYGHDESMGAPDHWHTYSHLIEYPLSLDRLELGAAVELACRGTHRTVYWRERWIGSRFKPALVVKALERATRRR